MSGPSAGRYVVESQIGHGGMATVWRAHDTVLDRQVALKRLRTGLRDDAESMARFLREARAVVRLSHPGVVRLLDRGDDAEGPYLVMELVDGEDLKARIARQGPLPPREAARICAQVASTLSYAHSRGVIHRDIKSQNVLIDAEGNVKLADFGIAHLLEVSTESGLTRSGMMVGTSDYLAPEQAQGRTVDGRADIYALGIVLWECLTGELPFPGENFVTVAMRQVNDPLPDPRELVPNVPRRLAACVLRATQKDPDARYATAGEFADELRACAAAQPRVAGGADGRVRSPRPRAALRRRQGRRRLVVLVVGVLVLIGVGWRVSGAPPFSSPAPVVAHKLPIRVTSYDPQGDGIEEPRLVRYATDGNPATSWYTEPYLGSATFGGLKQGVGLLIETPVNTRATRIEIQSSTPGAHFQIRTPGQLTGPPLVGTTVSTGAVQQIPLPPDTPHALVVWVTRLVPDPTVAHAFWAGVAEVSVWGVPNN